MRSEAPAEPALRATTPTRAAGNGREQPSTARGRLRRRQLLDAARVVFERDGFLDARVADIATAAGTAHGSFYTYFDSKAHVFRTLINEVMEAGLYAPPVADRRPGEPGPPSASDAFRRIDEGNRRYIHLFRRDRRLLALFEQVATFDEEMRQYRLELRQRSVDRVAVGIRRLQDWGLADRSLDADLAAHALNSMVTQFVYFWLVMGQELDDDASIATLTRLWAGAIGLPLPPPGPAPEQI